MRRTRMSPIPCSSPYATAVGGTLLFAQNGAIKNEVIWNELGALSRRNITSAARPEAASAIAIRRRAIRPAPGSS